MTGHSLLSRQVKHEIFGEIEQKLDTVPSQGAIAQLVERFHGMEEVRGSIPLSSTSMICEACKKDYEPEESYCPYCSALNQTVFNDEEMIVNDFF